MLTIHAYPVKATPRYHSRHVCSWQHLPCSKGQWLGARQDRSERVCLLHDARHAVSVYVEDDTHSTALSSGISSPGVASPDPCSHAALLGGEIVASIVRASLTGSRRFRAQRLTVLVYGKSNRSRDQALERGKRIRRMTWSLMELPDPLFGWTSSTRLPGRQHVHLVMLNCHTCHHILVVRSFLRRHTESFIRPVSVI